MTAQIQPGSHVRMHCRIALPDGTELLSTFGEQPLDFAMGDGSLAEGFELALYGLVAGDRQTLRLDAQHAYGAYDPGNIRTLPHTDFPAGMDTTPGTVLVLADESGGELAATVLEETDDAVRLDLNHPLAGREVDFTVEILSVTPDRLSTEP